MSYFLEQVMNGLSLGCMYAFIALGYTMVYGIIKLINFAHGEFFMVGGVLGYLALFYLPVERMPILGSMPGMASLMVAILVASFGTALFAVLCERLLYKPLRGEGVIAQFREWVLRSVLRQKRLPAPGGRIAALLTALGLSLFLQNGVMWVFSAEPRAWPDAKMFLEWPQVEAMDKAPKSLFWLDGTKKMFVFYTGQKVDPNKFEELKKTQDGLFMDDPFSPYAKLGIVFGALLGSGVLLYVLVLHTNLGKAMRAVSYNADAARLMGINSNQVISFTFFIGAFLAGVGGVLWGVRYGKIEPLMGVLPGLKAFVAAVLGGIGSIPGAILGGILLGLIETLVAAYGFSAFRDAVAFLILILILIVKPSGLLGAFEGEKI